MVGITSYGGYVPLFRLGKETAGWGLPFERAVANFDEDSLTMAVAAAIDCMGDLNRDEVDALYFATTTPPYLEKQSATLIAVAADLRNDIFTVDCTDTLRAGTMALKLAVDSLKAGSAKKILITAADRRLATPRSALEQNNGDGAAALMLGDKDVVAVIKDSYSIAREIVDIWRPEGDKVISSWEDRFVVEEGYMESMKEVISGLLAKTKLNLTDFSKIVYPAPDARRHREVAQLLKLKPEQIQDPLFNLLGNTGAAFALMLLVAALEEAKAGDRILLANYGDGADAFVLEVTEHIEKVRGKRGINKYLKAKKIIPRYDIFLQWRGFYNPDPGTRRPPQAMPSAPALLREQDKNLRFYGVKCRNCGTIQYPPQIVCTRCRSKDNFEKIRLSDKKGTLFTFSMDYIAGTIDTPLVISVVNFDGGGRALLMMTDREINEIKIGMPLEMSFRKLYTAGGIHDYYWKCIPLRV